MVQRMTKKHIRLYMALFLVSMLISATLVVSHANTQATTDVVYNSLSPDESKDILLSPSNNRAIVFRSTGIFEPYGDGTYIIILPPRQWYKPLLTILPHPDFQLWLFLQSHR